MCFLNLNISLLVQIRNERLFDEDDQDGVQLLDQDGVRQNVYDYVRSQMFPSREQKTLRMVDDTPEVFRDYTDDESSELGKRGSPPKGYSFLRGRRSSRTHVQPVFQSANLSSSINTE